MKLRTELTQIAIPVLAGLTGFAIGTAIQSSVTPMASLFSVPPTAAPYVSLAALACLDAICGGMRAGLEGKFHRNIFLSGFFINSALAGLLAYAGDRIGVDLYLAAIVVMGWRVFTNLSLLRRYLLTQSQIAKASKEG